MLLITFFFATTSMNIHIAVYTYSKIKSHTKPYKIFDFKSGHSTFYKQLKIVEMFRVSNYPPLNVTSLKLYL